MTTKLNTPPAHHQLVSRPRLVERLQEGLNYQLILISVPVGFGKTTLLSEMVHNLNNFIRVKKFHIKPVTEVLARAYQDEPLYIYFIPDASERRTKLPHFLEFSLRSGVLYGEV